MTMSVTVPDTSGTGSSLTRRFDEVGRVRRIAPVNVRSARQSQPSSSSSDGMTSCGCHWLRVESRQRATRKAFAARLRAIELFQWQPVRWWERWPERLARELRELADAGIDYELDEEAFAVGVLRLRLQP